MPHQVILASTSTVRSQLLKAANVPFETAPARVDEETLKLALLQEETTPRDIADALAEAKARKVGGKYPECFVIGCDQTLDIGKTLLSKPASKDEAIQQLKQLRGQRHALHSAAVIFHEGKPIWRQVGTVRLRMRDFTDAYLNGYVERNWDSIRHSVGGYKLEEEGIRLFQSIEGDYFHVLGLPLLEILAFLTVRGVIEA